MLDIEDFLIYVRRDEIPPEPPDGLSVSGFSWNSGLSYWSGREECTARGMWALVYTQWVEQLAELLRRLDQRKGK